MSDSLEALRLAISDSCTSVDIAKANERHFINIATAGFGAAVTVDTPVGLKNILGGGAYAPTGIFKAIGFVPYSGKMKTPFLEWEGTGLVAAVCNGRQAGGGQVLAPNAYINDGLLDMLVIKEVLNADFSMLLDEIKNPSS